MARDTQLAFFALAAPAPDHHTERQPRTHPSAKPKKDRQDIRQKWTREETEQEERAMWAGLCVRIPRPGVPQLWTVFGSSGCRLMCSWCGWSFDRRTNEVKPSIGKTIRACPRCPVEYPDLRPTRLPVDEDQEDMFESTQDNDGLNNPDGGTNERA